MSHILCYCEKCGQRTDTFDDNINNLKDRKCSGCLETGHIKPIPEKYISYIGGGTVPIYNEDLEEEIFKKIVKGSPNFDQAAWDRRIANREVRKRQLEMLKQEQANKPKCPICGSTSISKISTLNRAVSVGVFGLASSKRENA